MQTHQLERLLRLAQRTGGKLVITDAEGNQPVVILGIDEYEALLDKQLTTSRPKTVVERPAVAQPVPVQDDEADVSIMEEALMAVEEETTEEPRMIPVKSLEPEVEATPVPVTQKREPVSKVTESAGGEEQFYLEPL